MVTVIATRAFELDGRAIHVGEAVDLEPVQAAIRGRVGEVSLDPMTRATYQRRDMVATPVIQPVAVVHAVPAADPPVPKPPRRRRSRRKATA